MKQTFVPPRTFKTAIERIRDDEQKLSGGKAKRVTFEIIQGAANGKFTILGAVVGTTGDGTGLQIGQRVPVAWKDGQPAAIIWHHSRRAGGTNPLAGGDGIVEELFIAVDPDTSQNEVWFRNEVQISNLHIVSSGQVPDPREVVWGQRRDSFIVIDGDDNYNVFTIKRDPKKALDGTKIKSAKFVRKDVFNAFPATTLTTIDFNFHRLTNAPVWSVHSEVTLPDRHWVFTFNGPQRFEEEVSLARTVAVKLAGGSISFDESDPGCHTGIVTASRSLPVMDEHLDVFVTLRVRFDSFGCAMGSTAGLVGGSETVRSQPDLASCPVIDEFKPEADLNHVGFTEPFAPYFKINETHLLVLNLTKKTVILSTLTPTKALTSEETFDGDYGENNATITAGNPDAVSPAFIEDWNDDSLSPIHANGCEVNIRGDGGPPNYLFTANAGNLGQRGIYSSDTGLYDGGTPIPNIDPALELILKTVETNWPTSTWFRLSPTGASLVSRLEVSSRYDKVSMEPRFDIDMHYTPIYAKGGKVRVFFSVLRQALHPAGVPEAADDQTTLGVFLLDGSTVKIIRDFTASGDSVAELLDFSGNRVIYKTFFPSQFWMYDIRRGILKEIQEATLTAVGGSVLTNPDFMYATDEPKRFFVNGWNFNTGKITIDENVAHLEDQVMKPLKKLKDLPAGFAYADGTNQSYQTVNDVDSLSGVGRTLADPTIK